MVASAKASHIGSCLSMIDILAVLYSGIVDIDPLHPASADRDLVIVSKGHAAAGLYSILAHKGYFPVSDLQTFCENGSPLFGHVTSGKVPGVEFSTGSLGHGLAYASGLALIAKIKQSPRKHFVLMSDGECNEGSVWESVLFAAHHELGNLTAIVDRNRQQSFGSTETTLRLEPFAEKWRSFGWEVQEIDGHNHFELHAALTASTSDSPKIVIANTTKGKGVSFMENQVKWHYSYPNPLELELALAELEDHIA